MKHSRLFFGLCLALAVTAFSQSAAAFSLGRPRGATVLGQPLEVSVSVQASGDEDLAGLCVAADVYFGESPVEASLVRARLEQLNGGVSVIRVTVGKPVDEPVVSVYLRTGCQTQSVRKYVLLSEFASEVAPIPSTAGEPTNVSPSVAVANSSVKETLAKHSQGGAVSTTPKTVNRKRTDQEATGSRGRLDKASGKFTSTLGTELTKNFSGSEPARRGSRLKLQPLDVSSSWEPSLRMTDDLATFPTESGDSRRADAIALWLALKASPEEILQDAARRATLEAELQGLQAMSRANQLAMADLNQRVKSAQDSRFSNPLVYMLFALLVACGAVLMFVLRRLRRAGAGSGLPWWAESTNSAPVEIGGSGKALPPTQTEKSILRPVEQNTPATSVSSLVTAGVDIPLSDIPTGLRNPGLAKDRASATATKPTDFGHSVIGALRAINTQEMVDVRQQADFFLALGQYDEAIGLLQGALSQSSEANPYIYLDLIGLLHKLSRKDEYERIREVFNAIYTCYLPEFGVYHNEGRGLSDYSELCDTVVKLWPSRTACDFIEHCLVRQPSDSAETGIDRAAFTDLLLLHSILGEVLDPGQDVTASVTPSRMLPALQIVDLNSSMQTRVFPDRSSTGMHIDLELS